MDWVTVRLGLHLFLGSRRFGVNGRRREPFDSLMTRPVFGFGWGLALRPWAWRAAWRVVHLRMEIAGWRTSDRQGHP